MGGTMEPVTGYQVGLTKTRFRPSGSVPVQATDSTLTNTTNRPSGSVPVQATESTLTSTTNNNKDIGMDYASTKQSTTKDSDRNTDEACFNFVLGFIFLMIVILVGTLVYSATKYDKSLEFSVESLSFSPVNVSETQITGNWNMSLSVKNGPDMDIFYDTVKAFLYYKERFLLSGHIDPFYQGMNDQTMLQTNISASSLHVDHWIVTAIANEWTKNNAVDFNVVVMALVRLDPGSVMETNSWMRVSCGNVRASSNTTSTSKQMLGGSKKCMVNLSTHF